MITIFLEFEEILELLSGTHIAKKRKHNMMLVFNGISSIFVRVKAVRLGSASRDGCVHYVVIAYWAGPAFSGNAFKEFMMSLCSQGRLMHVASNDKFIRTYAEQCLPQ